MNYTPNSALRAVRLGMRCSQDDFARRVREAGQRLGEPNDASKRQVQRWESGEVVSPRPVYARALEAATGMPLSQLGFDEPGRVHGDSTSGHVLTPPRVMAPGPGPRPDSVGALTGIWLSRYEYFSSGRNAEFVGVHHVVLLQHGDRVTVRSLAGSSDSPLSMELTVDGAVLTGTWREETAASGYYRGAVYHGAIQLLAEPTGRRLVGKWTGFGKDMDVNVGPWELVFQTAGTDRASLEEYDRRPET